MSGKVPWVKPFLWGLVGGAVGIMIVGFFWLDWSLSSTVQKKVAEGRESAVVAALTPVCVQSFMKQPDAAKKLKELKAAESYERGGLVEKGGWATMPGGNSQEREGIARACAEALVKMGPK